MSITYFGWYHVVLMQPPDRKLLQTHTCVGRASRPATDRASRGAQCRSDAISHPCDVGRSDSRLSCTLASTTSI